MNKPPNLSKESVKVLRWLRDNPHHYSSWEPQEKFPDCDYMLIRGVDCEIKIPTHVTVETKDLLQYDYPNHLFYPKPEVLALIKEKAPN